MSDDALLEKLCCACSQAERFAAQKELIARQAAAALSERGKLVLTALTVAGVGLTTLSDRKSAVRKCCTVYNLEAPLWAST